MKLPVSFGLMVVYTLVVGFPTAASAQMTPPGDTSNDASLPVVSGDVQRASASLPLLAVQSHLGSLTSWETSPVVVVGGEATTGLAAGDVPQRFGLWASVNHSRLENTRESSAYDGHASSLMVGGEYQVDEDVIVGLGVGYERTDIDTVFNNGSLKADGGTVTPYIGYTITPWLRTSLMAGYSYSESDQARSGGTITGSQTTTRWFGLASFSANTWIDRFNLTGMVGYLAARDRNRAFTESNGTRVGGSHNTLGQTQVGGQVAYWMGGFMPYVSATYLNDVYRTSQASGQSSGRSAVRLGAGLNLLAEGGAFGGIGVTHEAGRRHAQSTSLVANIGFRF
jgi:hypothetical protein